MVAKGVGGVHEQLTKLIVAVSDTVHVPVTVTT